MDRDEAIRYLSRIRRCDVMIDNKVKELARLRDLAQSVSGVRYDGVCGSGGEPADSVAHAVERIIEAELECDALVDELVRTRSEVLGVLEKVKDPDQYDALHRRYVQGMSWVNVAHEMHYSHTWVNKLHVRGLDAVSAILESMKRS